MSLILSRTAGAKIEIRIREIAETDSETTGIIRICVSHLSVALGCKDGTGEFRRLKLARNLRPTEFGNQSGETVVEIVLKSDVIPCHRAKLITAHCAE